MIITALNLHLCNAVHIYVYNVISWIAKWKDYLKYLSSIDIPLWFGYSESTPQTKIVVIRFLTD